MDPDADVLDAAAELEALGLIRVHRSEAVFCANPEDRDFPPGHADCPGSIELRAAADEGGGDYACPLCDRVVYPAADAKRRVGLLVASSDRRGIERFIGQRLGDAARAEAFEDGVLVIPAHPQNQLICIVDFCTDLRFLTSEWIGTQPCVYVVVDPRTRVRLGSAEGEVRQVELVDLVCGSVTPGGLEQMLRSPPQVRRPTSGLTLNRTVSTSPPSDQFRSNAPLCRFAVGLVDQGIQVHGVIIEFDTSGLPYLGFAELLKQALSDVGAGREITPLTARQIAERIAGAAGKPGSVQKALKRLDRTIVKHLRRAGVFVDEGDVIGNVTRARKYRGQLGFRLNPDKVALDPRTIGQS